MLGPGIGRICTWSYRHYRKSVLFFLVKLHHTAGVPCMLVHPASLLTRCQQYEQTKIALETALQYNTHRS
jgi:hypothetical protein